MISNTHGPFVGLDHSSVRANPTGSQIILTPFNQDPHNLHSFYENTQSL